MNGDRGDHKWFAQCYCCDRSFKLDAPAPAGWVCSECVDHHSRYDCARKRFR